MTDLLKPRAFRTMALTGLLMWGGGISLFGEDRYFATAKNFEILHNAFRQLEAVYVDTIDVSRVLRNAIDGMLAECDPYTEYIPADEKDDLTMMSTGEYGGIGATIMSRDGKIFVAEPYEGTPAMAAGLQIGDEIVEIDGEKLEGKSTSEASGLLRGRPETTLKLLIRRDGKTFTKTLTRRVVVIPQVEYCGLLKPGIGYINLSGFTDKATAEVSASLASLKQQGANALILDLRSNGGGLLQEAVSISNLFLPKGETIVTTKGRDAKARRSYKTMREPVDTIMPIVVLIDGGTASSAEIVAGTFQDLDRAVLVGQRSFGKGLVQSTIDLDYEGVLKLTTAKYYMPSGRCIQAIDYTYSHYTGEDGPDRQRIPDSLTHEFRTRSGRVVRDGSGLTPDVEIAEERLSNLCVQLSRQNLFFDFANAYRMRHPKIEAPGAFRLSDSDYAEFCDFVLAKGVDYDISSRRQLDNLRRWLDYEGYLSQVDEPLKQLEIGLSKNLSRDLDLFKEEISLWLRVEIVLRYYHRAGYVCSTLQDDPVCLKAIEILENKAMYQAILSKKRE